MSLNPESLEGFHPFTQGRHLVDLRHFLADLPNYLVGPDEYTRIHLDTRLLLETVCPAAPEVMMASKRPDSFKIALDALRSELRGGVHPTGARLTANDITARLSLSATPVREALSRLAGEGLLQERRGQGFFVPRLTERDIVALLRLQMALLLIACDGHPSPVQRLDPQRLLAATPTPPDPQRASERLLRGLAAAMSPTLAQHMGRLQDQLAAICRLHEHAPALWDQDFAALTESLERRDPHEVRQALRETFTRWIDAAPHLARLHEAERDIDPI
ncbi:MAG: GntR family transcriptional regulator [Caulobacteraceae bacterium]|nr:GntR family transcriptional regulator [Caulobacteraceae bacterium]